MMKISESSYLTLGFIKRKVETFLRHIIVINQLLFGNFRLGF